MAAKKAVDKHKHFPEERSIQQFPTGAPREETAPLNNHYQNPQYPTTYNRPRSNTNGSGGWTQQSGNTNTGYMQRNDYQHKQQKKKMKQMGGPNNNNMSGKPLSQNY